MALRNQPMKRILAAIAVLVTAALPLAALSVFSITAAAAARFVAGTELPFATLAEELLAGLDASAAARAWPARRQLRRASPPRATRDSRSP